MTTKNRTVAALKAHLTRAKAKNDRKTAKELRARIKAVQAGQPDPGAAVKANGTPARSVAALRCKRQFAGRVDGRDSAPLCRCL